MSPPVRYTLDRDGKRFEAETEPSGMSAIARLFVDGVQVDERKSVDQKVQLEGGGLTVVVKLNWLDQVKEILAVPSGTDPKRADGEGIAFAPPARSRAARLEKLNREHPALYAARHVVIAALQVLIGVLGIGALLRGLLPRIDLPDIPLPVLPDIPWPDLPVIPWPNIPLPNIDVPDVPFLDQVKDLWSAVSWLVPIVIAAVIAWNEIDKRRKRDRAEAARQQGEDTLIVDC